MWIHLGLHRGKPLKVGLEVHLPPNPCLLIATDGKIVVIVDAEVQVPVVHVGAPGVLAHVRLHLPVQPPDPAYVLLRLLCSVLEPEAVVLEVVELPPVWEWRRRRRDAAHPAAVGVHDEEPGAVFEEPAPDALPHVARNGLRHVVGFGLEVPIRLGAPVQEQLHRLPLLRLHAELREAPGHGRDEAGAGAEVQGLELRILVLQDDAEEHVAGQRRRHLLPPGDKGGGGQVPGPVDGEHRDSRRYTHEAQLPGQHDAEAPAAAASDGPEEVLSHGDPVQERPLGVHDDGVDDVVRGEAVAADANRGADTTGEPEPRAVVRDGVVQLAERGARADPRRLAPDVDADGAERGEVDDGEGARCAEGAVGQALVVVATAARAHADAVARAAAHGVLDVGGPSGGDDGDRRRGRRRHEQQVLDGALEDRRTAPEGRWAARQLRKDGVSVDGAAAAVTEATWCTIVKKAATCSDSAKLLRLRAMAIFLLGSRLMRLLHRCQL
ncbi:hypothetical protein U9M48_027399, partial [Paspalum notatum var. saurae]